MRDGTVHIPFLVFGSSALIFSGVFADQGLHNLATALAIIGVFMFACNVAIFWRDARS